MKRRLFRRCGNAPGTDPSPEDQAVIDEFRALLQVLKNPKPWTAGSGDDIAVRIGSFVERAHPRPGDDHGPDAIAVSLQHPDTPHVVPYDRSVSTGWLRCDRHLIVGVWQPAYRILSHAAYGRALPEQPLPPAHYAVHITCPGRPLLRIGPYTQCHHADHDAARLRQRLHQPGSVAEAVPFDFDAFNAYHDPHRQNIDDLVVQEPSASPALEP